MLDYPIDISGKSYIDNAMQRVNFSCLNKKIHRELVAKMRERNELGPVTKVIPTNRHTKF
jgi:hypothetical protein